MTKQERDKRTRLDLEAGLLRLEDERKEAKEKAEKEWQEYMEDMAWDLMDYLI